MKCENCGREMESQAMFVTGSESTVMGRHGTVDMFCCDECNDCMDWSEGPSRRMVFKVKE